MIYIFVPITEMEVWLLNDSTSASIDVVPIYKIGNVDNYLLGFLPDTVRLREYLAEYEQYTELEAREFLGL